MEQLLSFMAEYASFMEKVVQDAQEHEDALRSFELKRIEKAIAAQQADIMKIGNLEKQREDLQESLGVGGKTFRELIELAQGNTRRQLAQTFERLTDAVEKVKEHNARSEEFVRSNMEMIQKLTGHQMFTQDRSYSKHLDGRSGVKMVPRSVFKKEI